MHKSFTDEVSGFVLAGGQSQRMGVDKSLLQFRGTTLVQHAVATLQQIPVRTAIVGNQPELGSFGRVIRDLRTGCGPLGGMEAALTTCTTRYALFMAVDTPLMSSSLLRLLVRRVGLTAAYATVPFALGRPQPLCAVYHRSLLPSITAGLDAGDYKVMRVMLDAARQIAGEKGIDTFAVEAVAASRASDLEMPYPLHHAFMNCNTPSDIAMLQDVQA